MIFSISLVTSLFAKENYILSIVNKIPITKFDVINRAKLISYTIDGKTDFNNLKKYYNQSLKTLIREKIILSAGTKIKKNIKEIVSENVEKITLNQFDNDLSKLNKLIDDLSIPKSIITEKYEAQLIWGIVLKEKYKQEFASLEKNINRSLNKTNINKNEDIYELAEIVIEKKNNLQLLNKIKSALKNGANFLEIAKQVSISSSAKFNGKIGWKNYDSLPSNLKNKKNQIREGDVFSFATQNKIKIIKILVKRLNGKISKSEHNVLVAQVRFPLNFQKKNIAYLNTKNRLIEILRNEKSCNNLNLITNRNNSDLKLKIIKSRVADLSSNIQAVISGKKLYDVTRPIFSGNSGYLFIVCDKQKINIKNVNTDEIKKRLFNKHFIILSDKLLKRLHKQASIIKIKNVN